MKRISLILPFLFLLSTSCKDDYTPFNSNTYDISGEWWIQYFQYNDDDSLELLYSYSFIHDYLTSLEDEPRILSMAISNTSANDVDSVWIEENFWPFKIKVGLENNIIKPKIYNSLNSDITVNLKEAKILKNSATSPSNRKTDSIFIKLELSDDEGTEYIISGYKNTGWPEDRQDL